MKQLYNLIFFSQKFINTISRPFFFFYLKKNSYGHNLFLRSYFKDRGVFFFKLPSLLKSSAFKGFCGVGEIYCGSIGFPKFFNNILANSVKGPLSDLIFISDFSDGKGLFSGNLVSSFISSGGTEGVFNSFLKLLGLQLYFLNTLRGNTSTYISLILFKVHSTGNQQCLL